MDAAHLSSLISIAFHGVAYGMILYVISVGLSVTMGMGDVALGVITAFHYSAAAERPANKAFVAAFKKEYGDKLVPGFMALGGYDAMDAIFYAIREQNGKLDPDRTMELFKRYKNALSPRGPIAIDPETRDVIQNIYLREVRKVGGQNANIEIETIGTAVKDPWKELKK